MGMRRVFHQIAVILTAAAYLSVIVGSMPGMLVVVADASTTQTHFAKSSMDTPLPCQDGLGCVTEAGCVFLTGAPARALGVAIPTASASAAYYSAAPVLRGLILAPALDPPIAAT